MDEFVTLVDEQDNVIGPKTRRLLTNDDRWRIVMVWITNGQGQNLITQRSAIKDTEPNLWSPAVAGTVEHASSYEQTAQKELYEELGIEDLELVLEGTVAFNAGFGKRVCGYFRAAIDKPVETLTLQASEITAAKWVNTAELRSDFASHPEKYVQNFGQFLDYFTSV